MATIALPSITVGGVGYAERVATVISAAFAKDALNRAVLLLLDSLPNSADVSIERRARHFLPNIKSKSESGTHLVEAGDWAATAAWFVRIQLCLDIYILAFKEFTIPIEDWLTRLKGCRRE